MLEKTYRARRFDDAVEKMKRDLGPDAVILSSRSIGAQAGEGIEIVAASHGADGGARDAGVAAWSSSFEGRLVRKGVPASTARALVARMPAGVGGPGERAPNARELEIALEGQLAFGRSRQARVRAYVGPTGVGKTTTIAKLAAVEALIRNRSVALVSVDHFRIGATEQLERYADLIGVPLDVAFDARSFALALERCADADAVFVDTAGRSPRDARALDELLAIFAGAGEPVETHLCLPAGMRQSELGSAVERHRPLDPAGLVVTKLDEALYFGSVVAAQALAGAPLMHFTTGQRVPEDIEDATAGALASLLIGQEVHE